MTHRRIALDAERVAIELGELQSVIMFDVQSNDISARLRAVETTRFPGASDNPPRRYIEAYQNARPRLSLDRRPACVE
jgi:hypothetical protein